MKYWSWRSLVLAWATGALLGILGIAPASIHAQDADTMPQACPAPQGTASPSTALTGYRQPVRIAANPAKGFYSPYFLFIPAQISRDTKSQLRLLVEPNNSGFSSDDSEEFEKDALKRICNRWRSRATTLAVAALVPAFPRPKAVYTHSLSRSTMTTTVPSLHRPDLQLIAMIDDAIAREAKAGMRFDHRVLIFGFSASAMFTTALSCCIRIAFLPQRTDRRAVGRSHR